MEKPGGLHASKGSNGRTSPKNLGSHQMVWVAFFHGPTYERHLQGHCSNIFQLEFATI